METKPSSHRSSAAKKRLSNERLLKILGALGNLFLALDEWASSHDNKPVKAASRAGLLLLIIARNHLQRLRG